MWRYAVAGMLAMAFVGCAAELMEIDEPDAAAHDARGVADAGPADASIPIDSSVHTPGSNVQASACGCRLAPEPAPPGAVALSALFVLGLARNKRRFALVRAEKDEHDERSLDEAD
jgi:MYXO-CTERM domain-containing protein